MIDFSFSAHIPDLYLLRAPPIPHTQHLVDCVREQLSNACVAPRARLGADREICGLPGGCTEGTLKGGVNELMPTYTPASPKWLTYITHTNTNTVKDTDNTHRHSRNTVDTAQHDKTCAKAVPCGAPPSDPLLRHKARSLPPPVACNRATQLGKIGMTALQ